VQKLPQSRCTWEWYIRKARIIRASCWVFEVFLHTEKLKLNENSHDSVMYYQLWNLVPSLLLCRVLYSVLIDPHCSIWHHTPSRWGLQKHWQTDLSAEHFPNFQAPSYLLTLTHLLYRPFYSIIDIKYIEGQTQSALHLPSFTFRGPCDGQKSYSAPPIGHAIMWFDGWTARWH
jgi:hypothetical protein